MFRIIRILGILERNHRSLLIFHWVRINWVNWVREKAFDRLSVWSHARIPDTRLNGYCDKSSLLGEIIHLFIKLNVKFFVSNFEWVKNFHIYRCVYYSRIRLDNVQTRVRWWRDGILLADSGEPRHEPPERVKMYSNRSLEVSHVKRNDTGEYVCQASRPAPWGHATQVHEIEVMCK